MIGFDIVGIIIAILYTAILIGIFYWIIKKAVKNGTIEAHQEIHKNDHLTPQ